MSAWYTCSLAEFTCSLRNVRFQNTWLKLSTIGYLFWLFYYWYVFMYDWPLTWPELTWHNSKEALIISMLSDNCLIYLLWSIRFGCVGSYRLTDIRQNIELQLTLFKTKRRRSRWVVRCLKYMYSIYTIQVFMVHYDIWLA